MSHIHESKWVKWSKGKWSISKLLCILEVQDAHEAVENIVPCVVAHEAAPNVQIHVFLSRF